MNYEFRLSPEFRKAVKALAKRYPSLKADLQDLRKRDASSVKDEAMREIVKEMGLI